MVFQKDPANMTPEQRLDALAEVLARGILSLAENDQLKDVLADEASPAGAKQTTGEKNGKDR